MTDWDATLPSGSIPFNTGDNDIRDNNAALEERLSKEHQFPSNPLTATSGRHKFGVGDNTARSAAYPSPYEGAGPWYNTTTHTIQMYASGGWRDIAPITARGDIITGNAANYPQRIPKGAVSTVLASDNIDPQWVKPLVSHWTIQGMTMSKTGARTLSVGVGVCSGADGYTLRRDSAIVKDLNSTWVAGTGNGGRASGVALTADTWYHVFAIGDWGFFSAEQCDVAFDTDVTGFNASDGGTYWVRRIGSILTDASSDIIAFTQVGRHFMWTTPPLDHDAATADALAFDITLSTPLGVKCRAHITALIDGGGTRQFVFSSKDQTDAAPSLTATPLAQFALVGGNEESGEVHVMTDANSVIRGRASAGSTDVKVVTNGWQDEAYDA